MASRFWVGGTGTWDSSTTTHWSATTGGAGGAAVPTSADTVTFDGSSGGGTVTVNFGGTITVQSITCGAFTGTLDFSANNNSVTLSASGGMSGSGSGTRTINLGNGTWTLNNATGGGATIWDFSTTTGLTFNANSSIIALTGDIANGTARGFNGNLTYSTITISAQTGGGVTSFASAFTATTFTVTGANNVLLSANITITTLNLNGTSTGQIGLRSGTVGTARTITVTTLNATWVALKDITGSGTATNSFDLGHNSGFTAITAPASASGMVVHPGMTGGCHG